MSGLLVNDLDLVNKDRLNQRLAHLAEDAIRQQISEFERIVVFDVTCRTASPREVLRRSVRKVHVDQSPKGAAHRIQRHLSQSEAHSVASNKQHLRIVNVWKPLVEPVKDHPLAMAESLSVSNNDLFTVKHIYPDITGETYAVAYSPEQKFLVLEPYDEERGTSAAMFR